MIKGTIDIDSAELEERIVERVIKALSPLLHVLPREDSLLSVKWLAGYLEMSEKWVYERVQYNEIPYTKLGSSVRFKKSDIDAWLDTLKTPTVNPLSSSLKVLK